VGSSRAALSSLQLVRPLVRVSRAARRSEETSFRWVQGFPCAEPSAGGAPRSGCCPSRVWIHPVWRSHSSSRQRETPGASRRDRYTHLSPAVPVTSLSRAAQRSEWRSLRLFKDGVHIHRLAVAFLRWCEGEPARSDRLAARSPQVVAPQACGFDRLAAPNRLSSGRALAGESNVTQRVLVVRHGRCRHLPSSLSRGRLHPTPHGLASNDSLELSGRPAALPRPELRPGRPATQLKR
jgi:hypothetical protein